MRAPAARPIAARLVAARPIAVRLVAGAVAVSLLGAGAAACTRDRPARPPLTLPAADRFRPGACADAADPVLALGRFTYDRAGADRLPRADYPFLAEQSRRLVAVRDATQTDPAVRDRLVTLLISLGFVRVRPGAAYDPTLLSDLETARAAVQDTCVGT